MSALDRHDPGGVFPSDAHRRVLAHLTTPDDPGGIEDVVVRVDPDVHTDLNAKEVEEVLGDLEAAGFATQKNGAWEQTKAGNKEIQKWNLDLHPGHVTQVGWEWLCHIAGFPPMRGGASFSDFWENAVLDATFKDPDISAPAACYLGLATSVPTDATTGTTLADATGATGYARKAIAVGDMSAASGGSKTNSGAITFDAITAGTATIVGWGVCSAITAGNLLVWGTATSTVISATQTPPTIAAGQLVVTLD